MLSYTADLEPSDLSELRALSVLSAMWLVAAVMVVWG
jgi:hypothetical protein